MGGCITSALTGGSAVEVGVRSWGLSAQEQDEVWARWRQGASLRLIARRMGKRGPSVRAFVLQSGGVKQAPRRRPARSLSVAEREEISRGVAAGHSCRAIACRLGRAPSTVSRELARNGGRGGYRAQRADAAADRRAARPKPCKLVLAPRLCAVVEAKLGLCWSPEQIAGWLPVAYPTDATMRISHETIYLSLYVQRRQALRGDLRRCLRTGRAMRHPRGKRLPQGRGQLLDTVPIHQRPAEANGRSVPGHWEGDLVLGKRPSAVLTLVERTSRSVLLVGLPTGWRADQVRLALTAAMGRLPRRLCRSLTWDHGKEMAEHARLTADTGVPVFFCDPRSPWQRASDENTNGLVRQYLPRTTALRHFSQADLDRIAAELNGRPRQILDFQTPSQILAEALP
jgi:IS30 family transposase